MTLPINQTLAASVVSRDVWELVSPTIGQTDPITSVIVAEIGSWYNRDSTASFVDLDVLGAILESRTPNEKHREEIRLRLSVLADIAPTVSATNVSEIFRAQKEYNLARDISSRLASGDRDVEDLLQQYLDLRESSGKVEVEPSIDDILDMSLSRDGLLPLHPKCLGQACDGGMYPEDHMVLFARPEIGKSLGGIHISSWWARHGKKGIWFENEDNTDKTRIRYWNNITGMTKEELRAKRDTARDLFANHGGNNVRVQALSPGSVSEIAHYVKTERPHWFVVNQIRNLMHSSRGMSRVDQMEAAATGIRNIAKKYGCAAISITQAGDSATNKLVLEQGDIDYSNTGVPASADIILGIGANEAFRLENMRELSTCKNKLSGQSEWHKTVKIDKARSTILETG